MLRTHLRVVVESGGTPIEDAVILLEDTPSYSRSINSSACGQAFFDDVSAATYDVTVTKAGYVNHNETFDVLGSNSLVISLTPL